jgi:hypothetical protein
MMAGVPQLPNVVARGGKTRAEVDTVANVAINTEESMMAPGTKGKW